MRTIAILIVFCFSSTNLLSQTLDINRQNETINQSRLAYVLYDKSELYNQKEFYEIQLTADTFSIPTTKISLAEILKENKRYYITTFAFWCAPCTREMKELKNKAEEWDSNQYTIIIFISSHENTIEKLNKNLKNLRENFDNDFSKIKIFAYRLEDSQYTQRQKYDFRNFFDEAIPESILYNKNVINARRGFYKDTFLSFVNDL